MPDQEQYLNWKSVKNSKAFEKIRGTTDGIFVLMQLMEKKLEGREDMAIGIIDLKQACDTRPEYIAMVTLRWMGIPEPRSIRLEESRRGDGR